MSEGTITLLFLYLCIGSLTSLMLYSGGLDTDWYESVMLGFLIWPASVIVLVTSPLWVWVVMYQMHKRRKEKEDSYEQARDS